MILESRFRVRNDILLSTKGRRDGNTTRYEQQVLASLVRDLAPSSVLEIGTFNGLSTYNIARNAPQARVVTVDLPKRMLGKTKLPIVLRGTYDDKRYILKESSGELFLGTPESGRITQVYCDSALLGRRIRGMRFDLIFVDGSHSYEYTVNDTGLALRHLNPGGVALWHDYGKRCWPGVKQALDELYASGVPLWRIPKTSFVVYGKEK